MIHFDHQSIDAMSYLYRINLINSASGYKSANLIGTVSDEGIPNVAVFSSITHIGSNPPLLGFFLRPTTVIRNTYDNIKSTGLYTINHIHAGILNDAHHTSAKYDARISEFDMTGLEEHYRENWNAPFVKHAPVQIGMRFVEEYPISANNTILVLGQIEHLYVKNELLQPDGFIKLAEGQVATINGLDAYAVPPAPKRFEYQRPKHSEHTTTAS